MSDDHENNPEAEADIHFKPVVQLAPVVINTLEDDEEEIFAIRAKLFRFDSVADPAEWKERGVGDIRMLKHKELPRIRLVMRRDKVLKICCNHFLTKAMKLKSHASSDRAFVWTTLADFADEEPKQELFAIRFRDSDGARKFREKFEELQASLTDINFTKTEDKEEKENQKPAEDTTTDDVSKKLDKLTVGAHGDS
ncbi:RANBP1 [Bugula neritina]|uniref:Ran-specific GTPase-activating protein n=1 Tax=Bugula neritina TaxID=10212 RepID=A0A7J7J8S4_BUGNE|nr:RANBP1 [Bugula neritina]